MVDSHHVGMEEEELDEQGRPLLGDIEDEKVNFAPEFEFIRDIPMRISVEMGRVKVQIKELLQLSENIVLEVDKMVGEPLEIHVNDTVVARGEVVVINEKFGIRLTDIIDPMESSLQ